MKKKRGAVPKRHGETYADVLTRQRMLKQAVKEAARDTTVQVEADIRTQRALWLCSVSVADAFGIGPQRMQRFFDTLQANAEELEQMAKENGEEYAYEKLREKAERVSGVSIDYLYEHEMLEAKKRHALEGVELDADQ